MAAAVQDALPARQLRQSQGAAAAVDLGVIDTLAAIGPGAQAAVPLLNDMLQMERGVARVHVAHALYHITGDDKEFSAAVRQTLRDNTIPLQARLDVLLLLAGQAPKVKDAVPILREALQSRDVAIVCCAADQLSQLGEAEALTDMTGLLSRKDPGWILHQVWPRCLGEERMIEAAGEQLPFIHRAVLSYLEKLGPTAGPAIPALKKFIAETDDLDNVNFAEELLVRLTKRKPK